MKMQLNRRTCIATIGGIVASSVVAFNQAEAGIFRRRLRRTRQANPAERQSLVTSGNLTLTEDAIVYLQHRTSGSISGGRIVELRATKFTTGTIVPSKLIGVINSNPGGLVEEIVPLKPFLTPWIYFLRCSGTINSYSSVTIIIVDEGIEKLNKKFVTSAMVAGFNESWTVDFG